MQSIENPLHANPVARASFAAASGSLSINTTWSEPFRFDEDEKAPDGDLGTSQTSAKMLARYRSASVARSPKAAGTTSLPVKELSVLISTWNMGDAKPPDRLDELLGTGSSQEYENKSCITGNKPSIIAIGVQESSYKVNGSDSTRASEEYQDKLSSQHLFRLLQVCAGADYRVVVEKSLWKIRLIILVHNAIADEVKQVQVASEATGIMNVIGNKGGVVASMVVGGTSLCFVSSHLAAHRGEQAARNSHVSTIVQKVRHGNPDLDITHQFHHCFWFGDLNYRIDVARGVKTPEGEFNGLWERVLAMIRDKDWAGLLRYDELRSEQRFHRILANFKEPYIGFPPTFKLLRQDGLFYKKQRIPAYCDRVLYSSLPGRQKDLAPVSFKSLQHYATSDHKPVVCQFRLISRVVEVPMMPSASCPKLVFSSIRSVDFIAPTSDGLVCPYINFFADPSGLIRADGVADSDVILSSTKLRTNIPEWDAEDLPILQVRSEDVEHLSQCHIFFALFSQEKGWTERLGQCILGFEKLIKADGEEVCFLLPIYHKTAIIGQLRCTASLYWPDHPQHKLKAHRVETSAIERIRSGRSMRKKKRFWQRKPQCSVC